MLETRRKDTGDVCVIRQVEQCCSTCAYFGFAPDGCGDCNLLIDYDNGEPIMAQDFDPETQKLVPCKSVPMVGAASVCDGWKQRPEERQCEQD